MRIRIKNRGLFGVRRVGLSGKIGKVVKSEGSEDPKKSGITIFFKGLDGLGAVSFSNSEIKNIMDQVSLHKTEHEKVGKLPEAPKKTAKRKTVKGKKAGNVKKAVKKKSKKK